MEVVKCNTKVTMETIGEARKLNTKGKMAESRFDSSDESSCWPIETKCKKQKHD